MVYNLDESMETFKIITEQSLVGIIIIQDGLFKYFNDRLVETTGYSAEEIKSWAPNEFEKTIYPEDREFIMEMARKKQAGDPNVPHQYSYRAIRKNGEVYWAEVFSKTINYKGRPADFLIGIEITDKVKAEQKLIETKEKYQKAYHQAEFYKDLFIHDINNTLQSLYSSIQLLDIDLENIKKDNEIIELINIMYRQVKRGVNLISNVRKLSQLEDHEISIREIDLLEFLKRSIEFIKNSFQDKKIQIKIDGFNEKILVKGNELLQDVFENILINSVRHNNNDIIEIFIKTSRLKKEENDYCKIEFIDNGNGIEDVRKEKVLDRVDLNLKTTYGMGLGLSLVKKIIENFGGKIWIEDRVKNDYSKGTNVNLLLLELPLHKQNFYS
ncbi:MAG: PAS domain S-box protein [Promethearchaeota archaeon]